MRTLEATRPHYITCLKPNPTQQCGVFDRNYVLQQLRYSGAVEVLRLKQQG